MSAPGLKHSRVLLRTLSPGGLLGTPQRAGEEGLRAVRMERPQAGASPPPEAKSDLQLTADPAGNPAYRADWQSHQGDRLVGLFG